MQSNRNTYTYLLLLLPLIYFAVFLHLDSRPFRVWDESYLALHTYEMMHDHNYLIPHSYGQPEMSNTKPPFVIWMMTASCSLFGFNELSIRLPNALAAMTICFILFFFVTYTLQSSFKGFLTVIVLISSSGFIRLHVTRTAEYDAFLVLFVMVFSLCYFLILENTNKSKWNILWPLFTLSVVLGILTKGVAALLICPGLLLYTLFQKKLLWLLKSRELYISTLFMLLFGVGYYLLREHYNPGYLTAVAENELGGRYTKQQIQTDPWLYLDCIINSQFATWLPFALMGLFYGLYAPKCRETRLLIFTTTIVIVHLSVISLGSTRLDWYDAPVFPFLALLAGSGIYFVTDYIFKASDENSKPSKVLLIALFLLLLAGPSYSKVIASDISEAEAPWDNNTEDYDLMYYLEMKYKLGADLNGYKVISDWYINRALTCEIDKWEAKGQKIEIFTNDQMLKVGDNVIINHAEDRAYVNNKFRYKPLEGYKNIGIWHLLSLKSD